MRDHLDFPRLFARIFNRALLIEPRAAAIAVNALAQRLNIGSITLDGHTLDLGQLSTSAQEQTRDAREYEVENGVAVVPVQGELAGRSFRLQPASGLTGYNAIGSSLEMAMADQDVRGILLDIDSPGGELGARDLAARIKSLDGSKPIWALMDDQGTSAAYYIASAADRIFATEDAISASIGSIAIMADVSKALEGAGIAVHVVRSGDMKGRPNEIEGIDAEGLKLIQGVIERTGEDFIKDVAANRGVSQKSVRDLQGAIVFGRDILTAQLADEIMPAHEVRQSFAAYVNRGAAPRRRQTGEQSMAQRHIVNTGTGDVREINHRPGQVISMTADELLVPEGTAPDAFLAQLAASGRQTAAPNFIVVRENAEPAPAPATQANAGSVREAVVAERLRIGQIVALPAAEGRQLAALRLALSSDLTPEQAAGVLDGLGQTGAGTGQASAPTPWDAMMQKLNPKVGVSVEKDTGPQAEAQQGAAGILSFVPDNMRRKA